MILITASFKVANGMEQEVRDAFLHRPRLVEEVAGFLGIEVYADIAGGSVFSVVTRWTDLESFKAWHNSEGRHLFHHGIPEIRCLERLPSDTQVDCMEELVANTVPLLSRLLGESRSVHLLLAERDGTIRLCNDAFPRSLKLSESQTVGGKIWDLMTESDAETLRERVGRAQRCLGEKLLLNFVDADQFPFTLNCLLDVQPGYFLLVGEVPRRENEATQVELLRMNNELAVLSRENARKGKELEQARAELAATLENLQSSHWHLKKIQEVLPICMECGKVKAGEHWEELVKYLKANALFLSHGYCPDCLVRMMSQYGLSPRE